jgi:hypothetical protein
MSIMENMLTDRRRASEYKYGRMGQFIRVTSAITKPTVGVYLNTPMGINTLVNSSTIELVAMGSINTTTEPYMRAFG